MAEGNQDEPLVDQRGNAPRVFPLKKEVMTEFLHPVSAAALVGICTGMVLPLQGSTNAAACKVFRTLFFAFLPFGLVGQIAAITAKSVPRLVGAASGFLLFEFCFIHVLGSVIAILEFNVEAWPALIVALFLIVATVFMWRYCCSYPKFLRCERAAAPVSELKCQVCNANLNAEGLAVVQAAEGENRCACGAGVAPGV